MYIHTEQLKADKTAIRIDVISNRKTDYILQDMNFLNYRLASVERSLETKISTPDIIWFKDEHNKTADFAGDKVVLKGAWFEGEIQSLIVSYLATRLMQDERYIFHASAVNYKGKTVMFMGGEGNRGKTMSQVAACKRGAKIVSTETLVLDYDGNVINGSKNIFLRQRAKGTERIDKPNQDEGVAKFFDKQPDFELFEGKTAIDFVVLPDIDGNYATVVGNMSKYEKEYQTFHCLCSYIGSSILLASELPMPLFDNTELRFKRARFIKDFTKRQYTYIRSKGPQIIIDELDKII
jgi:hypothetical protein